MFDLGAAARADVIFEANVSGFRADVTQIRAEAERTYGALSADTLKAALASDKYDRALARSKGETFAVKKATATYRQEMAGLDSQTRRTNGALQAQERNLGRVARGALAGSGALGSLRRAAVFASSSFLGGFGLVYAIRQVIGESSQLQEETEKTGVVFGRNARDVQRWARSLALSFGVSEGAALKAAGVFGNMLRPLGFGEKAAAAMSKRLVELSADMASFNNVKPDVVLAALSSGLAGQVRPLRQYGVFLSQTRLQEEAYADGLAKKNAKLTQAQKVQAAYNIILKDTKLQQGDVARNTGSLSVAQSKLTAELQDAESTIGRGLLPTEVRLANAAAKRLDQLNKSGKLQREVNKGLHTAADVVHGLEGAYHVLAPPVRIANRLLGGTENTVKLLVIAFAGLKLKGLAGELRILATMIRGVGTAAATATPEVNAFKTAEERPDSGLPGPGPGGGRTPFFVPAGGSGSGIRGRVGQYTGAPGGGGGSGFAGRGGGWLGLLAGAFVLGNQGESGTVEKLGGPLKVTVSAVPGGNEAIISYTDPVDGKHRYFNAKKGASIGAAILADIQKRHPGYRAKKGATGSQSTNQARQEHLGQVHAHPDGRTGDHRPPKPKPLVLALNYRQQNELLIAQSTKGTGDDLRVLNRDLGVLNRALTQKGLTPEQQNQLLSARNDVLGQIDAITSASAGVQKAHAQRAKDTAAKARKKRIDALTRAPVELRIAEKTAEAHGASEQKIVAILKREKKAIEQQIVELRHIHAGKEAIAKARASQAAIQKRIDSKKSGGAAGSIFDEAASEFKLYGSNIAGRGEPLSGQDARGLLGAILLEMRHTRRAGQATAGHTRTLAKNRRTQHDDAREAAAHGY